MKHLSMEEYIRTIENISDGTLSLFLGAGASIQSGIPSAGDMIWEFKRKLYCSANQISEEYYKDMQSEATCIQLQNYFDGLAGFPLRGNYQEYSFYFEKCYPTLESRRDYIFKKTSDKKPSIGYLCLGSLINQKILNTVFTTNFDPLIEFGVKSVNPIQQIVTISSSVNPQISIVDNVPLIIKMHGDYLYDRIQNTEKELQKLEQHIEQLSSLKLSGKQLLVIGYSGNDASIVNWFKNNLNNSQFASKGIYWCTLKKYGVSEKVTELLGQIEQSGRDVGIVEISNFDDFLYRIYLAKCTEESAISELGETQTKLYPFTFDSSPRSKPFIKFNAFITKQGGIPLSIHCGRTSIEDYKTLRGVIGDMPIVAVLKKGMIYFACEKQYIKKIRPHITDNFHEVNFNSALVNRDNSVEISLLYDLIFISLTKIPYLRRIGKRKIINTNTLTVYNRQYSFYEAALISLQCNNNALYLIITPTVELIKTNGGEMLKEERKVITNSIISKRYNNKFGESLLAWQKTINNGTDFTFSLGDFKLEFDRIAISNGGYLRKNNWPTLDSYEFTEPKMQLAKQCYVNQLKGLVEDGPFDAMFPGERPPVRIAILSHANSLETIYMHLYNLLDRCKTNKPDGFLVDYPGFKETYRRGLDIPKKGSPLILTYNDNLSSLADANGYYILLTSKINALLDKTDTFDVLVIHIPKQATHLRQREEFDLHDALKLFCANHHIKVQIVEDKSIIDNQKLKVTWGLSTGIFAKANGELWRPRYFDDETAFIGISYSMLREGGYYVGCSQLFDSCGNGMRLIINQLKDPKIIRKNPYMSKEDAQYVIGNLLRAYYHSTPTAKLKRVVVHKSSDFQQSEIDGINMALASIEKVELLQIQEYSDWRAVQSNGEFNEGLSGFSVKRGLTTKIDDDKLLIWTHGCIKDNELLGNRNYYKGGRGVPSPILVKRYQGNSSADLIVKEIMMLTKMNWNSGDSLYKNLPVTIDFSKIVAKMAKQNIALLNQSYDFRYFM
ncbi:MAG: SIR2 family protein [Ruminococcus flavefaciens]|nr:SIR2 family protein [Ruminococcus flavefaciens]